MRKYVLSIGEEVSRGVASSIISVSPTRGPEVRTDVAASWSPDPPMCILCVGPCRALAVPEGSGAPGVSTPGVSTSSAGSDVWVGPPLALVPGFAVADPYNSCLEQIEWSTVTPARLLSVPEKISF